MTEFRRLMVRQLEKELYFLNNYPRQGKKKDTVTREAAQHMVRALACVGIHIQLGGMTNRDFDQHFQNLLMAINSGAHREKGTKADQPRTLGDWVDKMIGKDKKNHKKETTTPPPPPIPIPPPYVVPNREVKPSQPLEATAQPAKGREQGPTASTCSSDTARSSGSASPKKSSALTLKERSRTSLPSSS